jgi:hypothetical protein
MFYSGVGVGIFSWYYLSSLPQIRRTLVECTKPYNYPVNSFRSVVAVRRVGPLPELATWTRKWFENPLGLLETSTACVMDFQGGRGYRT